MLTALPVGRAGQPRPLASPPASCGCNGGGGAGSCPMASCGRDLVEGLGRGSIGKVAWTLTCRGQTPLLPHQTDEGDAHLCRRPRARCLRPGRSKEPGGAGDTAPQSPASQPCWCPRPACSLPPPSPATSSLSWVTRWDKRSAGSPSLWAAANSLILCCSHFLRVSFLPPPPLRSPVPVQLPPQSPTSPVNHQRPRPCPLTAFPDLPPGPPASRSPPLSPPHAHCGVRPIRSHALPHPA